MAERLIGYVTHYYNRIGVAALHLIEPLQVGDQIRIEGPTTYLEETVDSMEIEHRPISEARPGDDLAIKVVGKVREGDKVYQHLNGIDSSSQ